MCWDRQTLKASLSTHSGFILINTLRRHPYQHTLDPSLSTHSGSILINTLWIHPYQHTLDPSLSTHSGSILINRLIWIDFICVCLCILRWSSVHNVSLVSGGGGGGGGGRGDAAQHKKASLATFPHWCFPATLFLHDISHVEVQLATMHVCGFQYQKESLFSNKLLSI